MRAVRHGKTCCLQALIADILGNKGLWRFTSQKHPSTHLPLLSEVPDPEVVTGNALCQSGPVAAGPRALAEGFGVERGVEDACFGARAAVPRRYNLRQQGGLPVIYENQFKWQCTLSSDVPPCTS